jgi:hypothetical protein
MNNRITAIFKNFDMKSKGEGFLYFCLKFAILSAGRETSTLSESVRQQPQTWAFFRKMAQKPPQNNNGAIQISPRFLSSLRPRHRYRIITELMQI